MLYVTHDMFTLKIPRSWRSWLFTCLTVVSNIIAEVFWNRDNLKSITKTTPLIWTPSGLLGLLIGKVQTLDDEHLCNNLLNFLTDTGKARAALQTPLWLTDLFSHALVKIYLRQRHGLMVRDGAFSHEIDYLTIFIKIVNL